MIKNLPIFDYLRALSVFLVVWGHIITYSLANKPYIGEIANSTKYLDYNLAANLFLAKFVNLGDIGVAIFFLLSGFLIIKSRENKQILPFILSRLIRIYPLAAFGVIITYVSVVILNYYYFQTPISISVNDFLSILGNSLLIHDVFPVYPLSNEIFITNIIIPVYWFLCVIIKFYIIIALFNKWDLKRISVICLCLLIVSLLYCSFKDSSHTSVVWFLNTFAFSAHHIIYIFIGASTYFLSKQFIFENKKFTFTTDITYPIIGVIIFVLSFSALKRIDNFPLPFDMLKNYFIALVVFVTSIICIKKIENTPKFIKFISDISYSLFIIHFAFGGIFLFILGKIDFLSNNLFLLYSVTFIFIIGMSYAIHKYVEIPSTKYLSKIINHK